jgi:hypothetical protein
VHCSLCDLEADATTRGWRAYQTQEEDDMDTPGAIRVGVFCSECAETEFGPLR